MKTQPPLLPHSLPSPATASRPQPPLPHRCFSLLHCCLRHNRQRCRRRHHCCICCIVVVSVAIVLLPLLLAIALFIAIAIALAAFTIALILARHPPCHRHCPLCPRRSCMPAIHFTVAIAMPPSPSSSPTNFIAVATTLIFAHHSCCLRHCPCCCHLPTTLVAIAIALVFACHPCPRCHCPFCCLSLHFPATLVAAVPLLVGGGRTIPIWCAISVFAAIGTG
jgi:hypothetical protein